jgi:MOSC domain-containing protein YiiM
MAELKGIALAAVKKGLMVPMESGEIDASSGLIGNRRGKRTVLNGGKRQITLISEEQWNEACEELGITKPWFSRRATLCVSGHKFKGGDVGHAVQVGPNAILRITGETTPCERMDEIHPGLRGALSPDWRGGVTCEVLLGGMIRIGDQVVFI